VTFKRTRDKTPFAKITARFHRHPKRERTLMGCAVDGVLARALSKSRDEGLDGFVSEAWAAEQVEPRHRRRLIEAMVKPRPPRNRPLFDRVEGGFLIHDYLEVNPSEDEMEQRRQGSRGRVAKHRNGGRQQSLETDPHGSGVTRSVTRYTSSTGTEEEPLTAEGTAELDARGRDAWDQVAESMPATVSRYALEPVALDGYVLTVRTHAAGSAEWVAERFGAAMEQAASEALDTGIRVEVVEPTREAA
jgi:hypothetical protein